MTDRFTSDRRLERDRLLAAWLRREKITTDRFFRFSDAEHREARASAESSGILIPRTEPGFLYHGTSAARIRKIRDQGLLPNALGIWGKGEHALHAWDRVFFCDTVGKALWYAREMSRERPALLRLPAHLLPDATIDRKDTDGSVFVERPVPPHALELWTRGGWAPLAPEPEKIFCTDPDETSIFASPA